MQFTFECKACKRPIQVDIKHQHGDTIEFEVGTCHECSGRSGIECKGKEKCDDYQKVHQRALKAEKVARDVGQPVDDHFSSDHFK